MHEAGGLLVLKGGTSGFSQKNHVFVKNAFFIRNKWIFEELVGSCDPVLNYLKETYILVSQYMCSNLL